MLSLIKKLFGSTVNLKEALSKGALLVDVRTKKEYEAGHIEGSLNVPLDTITSQLPIIKKRGKPVIIVCASGTRSAIAKGILKNADVEVYNGGSWLSFKNKYK